MIIQYLNLQKIPYININLFNKKGAINLIKPISQNDIMNIIQQNSKKDDLNTNHQLVNFYLLKSYPHIDMGWILSGFLESGTIQVDQDLLWYDNDKINVSVKITKP